MRAVTSCWIALALVGCTRPADKPAESGQEEAAPAAEAPAGVSLADLAGTWNIRSTVRGKESTVVTYDMVATADRDGWSIKFPDRDPIPVRIVAVEGDSVVSEATVRTQVKSILNKLEVSSQLAAVGMANQIGWRQGA